MQRELKFRGKRFPNDSEWIEGNLVKDTKGRCRIVPFDVFKDWDVLPETIGQFTGLKDKNGVEIYEGDLIEFVRDGVKRIEVIEFRNFGFSVGKQLNFMLYQIAFDDMEYKELEVVGNIHNNKDLIK